MEIANRVPIDCVEMLGKLRLRNGVNTARDFSDESPVRANWKIRKR